MEAGAAILAAGDEVTKANDRIASGAANEVDKTISQASKKAQSAGACELYTIARVGSATPLASSKSLLVPKRHADRTKTMFETR